MNWTKPLVFLVALGVVVWTIGSLVSLVVTFGNGGNGTAVAVVVGLLVVSLAAAGAFGARGRDWLENPRHYW